MILRSLPAQKSHNFVKCYQKNSIPARKIGKKFIRPKKEISLEAMKNFNRRPRVLLSVKEGKEDVPSTVSGSK